ncbi:DsbA family oxidoreductase [Xanthomonas euvesicatoria]|uniref:DsbA family oxidoreductase n=1 Tax=Xanthomonas euvesicatoria TaxID=456327 RepID=UPI0004DF1AEC|nr:DsbA family oxidoreductase [Xanthomonas euvesicatoria]
MKSVKVEVWADFVCPWCWIAKRRFEKAVAAVSGQVSVTVSEKAYRLARGAAPMAFKSALYQKFGGAQGAERMMAAVREQGRSEGLDYRFDTMRFGDTTAAHALVKSIASPIQAKQMSERLYKAVTTDGLDIFDPNVLGALAEELGVSGFEVNIPAAANQIAEDEADANQVANGVPLFVFNNKLYLSGAQESAVFERALLDAAVDAPVSINDSAAESCGIDGCR